MMVSRRPIVVKQALYDWNQKSKFYKIWLKGKGTTSMIAALYSHTMFKRLPVVHFHNYWRHVVRITAFDAQNYMFTKLKIHLLGIGIS